MDILTINRKLIDGAVRDIKKSAPEIEAQLYEEARKLMLKFNIKNGRFDPTESPYELILEINRIVRNVLRDSDYDSEVDQFIKHFDEIGENVSQIHKETSGLVVGKRLINAQKNFAIESTISNLKSANMDVRYVEPLRKTLFRAVTLSMPVTDTERELRVLIKGQTGEKGLIERWVGQVARDAMNQYQGAIHTAVATEFDLKEIMYVGSLVNDSRAQCRRWVDKNVIKFEELAREIAWAYANGKGMIPATTIYNFLLYRGGYNCRHEAIPV